MPSPVIALDLLNTAARAGGILASGETFKDDEANDALGVLNDLLENWSTERLSVWGQDNLTFATVPGQASYTIGPAGNFNGVRPLYISAAYCSFGGVDFPIEIYNQQQYDLISIKTMQQPIVEKLLYVTDFPLGRITLWPVPMQAIPLVLSADRVLTFPVTLASTLSGPPGFIKALRTCLTVELCPQFGVEPTAAMVQISSDAKGDYKKTNMVPVVARYDDAIVGEPVALWQRGY